VNKLKSIITGHDLSSAVPRFTDEEAYQAFADVKNNGIPADNDVVTLTCRCGASPWSGKHRDFVLGSMYARWYALHRGEGHGVERRHIEEKRGDR
jgi:hypothetical protein